MPQSFNPARGAHSLIETVFFVNFAPSLEPEKLKPFGEPLPELMELFTNHAPSKEIQFRIDANGMNVGSEGIAGAEYTKRSNQGDNDWVLRISSASVSVHCLNYTRWDEVWPFAKMALSRSLDRIPDGTIVSVVGFKNVDHFEFVDKEERYTLSDLFKSPNPYIADIARNRGFRWHCHTGWFEEIEPSDKADPFPTEVLNQLNLGSSRQTNPSGSKLVTVVDHNLLVHGTSDYQFTVSADSEGNLENLMSKLHRLNKAVLKALLIDDMQRRINLSSGVEN